MTVRSLWRASLLAAALCLGVPAYAAAADVTFIPDPVTFQGSGGQLVRIRNTSNTNMRLQVSVTQGFQQFSLQAGNDQCVKVLNPGEFCTIGVRYTNSGLSEDHGTLRAQDTLQVARRAEVQLIGNRGQAPPRDTTAPNCTLAAKRNQKLIKLVRRRSGRRVVTVKVRTPFNVSLLSSEDGTVSASATGKDSKNRTIKLKAVSAAASAGHGVVLKLKLESQSENRILADVRKNLVPKLTFSGACVDRSGNARGVGSVIRFRDNKAGRAFAFPLIADILPR
jgi:P pilus assembly chaperone PapD